VQVTVLHVAAKKIFFLHIENTLVLNTWAFVITSNIVDTAFVCSSVHICQFMDNVYKNGHCDDFLVYSVLFAEINIIFEGS